MIPRVARSSVAAFLALSSGVVASYSISAQEISAVKGGLQGVVTDGSGAAIPNAKVTVVGNSDRRVLTADANGDYSIGGLTPGLYTVTATLEGFKTTQLKGVEVVISRLSTLNLSLSLGAVSDTVNVDANSVQIETTSTSIGDNLDATFYQEVPVARNVGSLFYISPGAVNSGGTGTANPSIGGATGLENQYIIDGVNLTDVGYGGLGVFSPTYGSLGTGINLSFIQEVQVKEGALEPKYGKANGGVALIVTKTGGSHFHGALSAYAAPEQFGATQRYADNYFNRVNTHGRIFAVPQFDAAIEVGGYVPQLRDHLFFFGAFNPSLNQVSYVAPAGSGLAAHGPFTNSITGYSWAGKLTYKASDAVTLEASAFGDPSSSNFGLGVANEDTFPLYPNINAANTTLFSRWGFGSRSEVARLNAAPSSTWSLNLAATAKQSHFTEGGFDNTYNITDFAATATNPLTGAPYGASSTAQGLGFFQNPTSHSYSVAADTEKIVKLGRLGTHSLSIGWEFDRAIYDLLKGYSGPNYTIPSTNDVGTPTDPLVAGASTNAAFRLQPARDCPLTLCPFVSFDEGNGVQDHVPVYLQQVRGIYSNPQAFTSVSYHQIYGNDDWTIGKRVTFNAGIRWDEEQLNGVVQQYVFNRNWSPRVGINIDPFADRKSKIFFNFARYTQALPADAAVRELNQESDILRANFAPAANADGSLLLNAQGTATPVLDAAHLLSGNSAAGTLAGKTIAFSGGGVPELIAPGTKLNLEEEFVGGIERQMPGGFVLSARYMDRRLLRIIEDMSGISPEGANAGLNQVFLIGNPSSSADYFTNEQEQAYDPAVGPPANCPLNYGTQLNSAGQSVGAACGQNPDVAGIPTPDGISDGFANPRRHYQSFEIEMNKNFSHNFLLRANYRFAKLYGNYEGLYRNDNGQSDPGISSLFDFTQGVLGLLGNQFTPGYLNTDRRNVGNLYGSYVVPKTFLRNLTGGLGLRGASGTPISNFGAHPVYDNAGEIPLGGRGSLGRIASNYQLDLHADFPINITDSKRVKLTWDTFNVTNSRSLVSIDQDSALNSTTPNVDFLKPLAFQRAFYARGAVRFEF